ncbi:F-box domain-containing protein [Colletotrichum abscissum]|uniref:F-box domain-containing protein n=1 Tax=Colletotrichum abscissum TaxID=1671311 RepID=UPI0027D75589|nr:F-box domain-containing protein [Colletotrichum abscissum]KAK1518336.1 F-box domain-containing protein [Colletotrichum abscissum]
MTYIANSLNLHDIFNLSLVCQQFRYLVDNDDICRAALETHAPYSADFLAARSSKHYARCLRRLVKLRDAIATAKPYTTALVAHAVDFIYCNGTLCYTESYEVLRLLNLHASSDSEDIIDTRILLQSVPGANLANSKYKFRPIHFAHGVLSCLYSPPKTEGYSRLVVINLEKRTLLTAQRLESTSKLFVRNNQNYLYYGTHSVTGDDGFKRWVLRRFDLRTKQWIPGHLDLEDLAGSDIGTTVSHQTPRPNEISSWPPEVDVSQRNVHLDALDNILYPKGQITFGNISGVMDERSLVYAIGQRGSQTRRPLVFICFDPSIKLTGLARWPGGPTRPPCNHKATEGDNARDPGPYPTPQSLPVSAPGSRNSSFSEGFIPDPSQTSANVQEGIGRPDAPSWIRRASAAYLQPTSALENPVGFNFAFCKDHSVPCRCC